MEGTQAFRAIEASSFPDDIMEVMQESEARLAIRLASKLSEAGARSLQREARGAAVTFLCMLADRMSLSSESFTQVVVNFDVYCQLAATRPNAHNMEELIRQLPDVCTSLCLVAYKVDTSIGKIDWTELHSATEWFEQALALPSSVAQQDQDETKARIVATEAQVLEALGWRTEVTTAEKWLSAFCARLEAATNGVFGTLPGWIWQRGMMMAKAVMQWYTAFDIPPRVLALGLFCSGFIAAGVLSAAAFQSSSLTEAKWVDMLVTSNRAAMPPCGVSPAGQRRALALLQFASKVNVMEMKESSRLVVSAVCEVVAMSEATGTLVAAPVSVERI